MKYSDNWMLWAASILTVFWVGGAACLFFYCSAPFYQENGLKLNELGDFSAGVAAPLAFGWFLIAVFLQRKELELTRNELEGSKEALITQAAHLDAQVAAANRQNIENTFFNLLKSWNDLVEGLSYELVLGDNQPFKKVGNTEKGRNVIESFAYNILNPNINTEDTEFDKKGYDSDYRLKLKRYNLFPYIRMVERILAFVDTHTELNEDHKKEFVSFLQAHFSQAELAVLCFHTFYDQERPLVGYIQKYHLLDDFHLEGKLMRYRGLPEHLDRLKGKNETSN